MLEYEGIKKELSLKGVNFEPGLNDDEIKGIENKFNFSFPESLRNFLREGLPTGERFPNWRDKENVDLMRVLEWPLDGLIFDLENNNFWLKSLGEKPIDIESAKRILIDAYVKAPKLIPIYGHRYIPSLIDLKDVPVLSVHQSDVIYYGSNLENYLKNEFINDKKLLDPTTITSIPFWTEVIEHCC